MGQLKDEGRAVDVSAPADTAITFGELYRVSGWSGIAMSTKKASVTDEPERGFALETTERIWYFKIPAALAAARGARLYWSAGAGFKSGQTDLVAEGTAGAIGPCVKVDEAKDANNVIAGRVLTDHPAS